MVNRFFGNNNWCKYAEAKKEPIRQPRWERNVRERERDRQSDRSKERDGAEQRDTKTDRQRNNLFRQVIDLLAYKSINKSLSSTPCKWMRIKNHKYLFQQSSFRFGSHPLIIHPDVAFCSEVPHFFCPFFFSFIKHSNIWTFRRIGLSNAFCWFCWHNLSKQRSLIFFISTVTVCDLL